MTSHQNVDPSPAPKDYVYEEEYTEVYQKANGFPPLNVVLKTELFIGAFLYIYIIS